MRERQVLRSSERPKRGLSVIVPAHNEAARVGRLLEQLRRQASDVPSEVIVVANGCQDDTADIARSHPRVTVIELTVGSKTAALRAGDEAANFDTRIYIDADVTLSAGAVTKVYESLQVDSPRIAAPTLIIDTSRSPRLVRSYYRIWFMSRYASNAHVGSGFYGLNFAAHSRIGEFPDVVADDLFVSQHFRAHERHVVSDEHFSVRAPRSTLAAVRRNARMFAGNATLDSVDMSAQRERSLSLHRRVRTVIARSIAAGRPIDLATYAVLQLSSRGLGLLMRKTGRIRWNQDRTTRLR